MELISYKNPVSPGSEILRLGKPNGLAGAAPQLGSPPSPRTSLSLSSRVMDA
ncbi:MAG: hypothetical protein Ct9H300mP28_31480 [Pseudomonadota bacterium]|nr:MAG: hypothetical protein Ct9H300mP28_31480 [Pseudomonadota bacterium]